MHYPIKIFYSEEDKGFLAGIPDLPGCSAFGETEEDAIKEVKLRRNYVLRLQRMRVERYPCRQ